MAECHEQLNNEPYVVPPAEYVQGNVAAYKRENEQMRALLNEVSLEYLKSLGKTSSYSFQAIYRISKKWKELKESWK